MLAPGLTSLAQAAPVAEDALAWAAPAAATAAAGQTSATITWAAATGGAGGYTYSAASVVYDSQGASTTASVSTSGSGAGTTTVSGLVNGQVVVVARTVTDADGTVVPVQGVVAINAGAATITPGTAPASQSLAAGSTSATIGTWGAPSGGTGPYTYAVTELTNNGTTVGGSGLGPWTAAGLSDGQTYAYLLTITDSLSAKGYSVVTVSVAAGSGLGAWTVVDECDFTDANWTALSSTSTTASTTAWQHILYAADGTTPRAYVYNNSAEARTLSLSPSGQGLTLVNGTSTAQPTIGVWPAGWDTLRAGSRRDAWLIEIIFGGEEPSGTLGFGHDVNVSTSTSSAAGAPGTGGRVVNSGSNIAIEAASYISAFASKSIQTVTAGVTRAYTCGVQVTIADSRRHDIFTRVGATDYGDPQSGQRVRVQSTSTTMSNPGADVTTSAAWFGTSISARTKCWMLHNGSATSGSNVRLIKLRLLRKVNGSL